jgi:hypothetical protein
MDRSSRGSHAYRRQKAGQFWTSGQFVDFRELSQILHGGQI